MTRKRRMWDFNEDEFFHKIFRSFEEEMQALRDSNLSENQPITFGYSVRVGPDTNYQPEVRKWGNLSEIRKKQGLPEIQGPIGNFLNQQLPMRSEESSNRYVDFIEEDESLRIIMEVPGFSKEDLAINIDEKGAEITVQSLVDQQLKQVITLPVKIELGSTKTTLKNGILEIIGIKDLSGQSSSKKIKIKID